MFYYKNNGVKLSCKFVMYTHKIQQIGINEFNTTLNESENYHLITIRELEF